MAKYVEEYIFDARQAMPVLRSLELLWVNISKAQAANIKTTHTIDQETNKVTNTVKRYTTELAEGVRRIDVYNAKQNTLTRTIQAGTSKILERARAQTQLNSVQRQFADQAAIVRGTLTPLGGPPATPAEEADFQLRLNRLSELMQKHQVTAATILQIWQQARAGTLTYEQGLTKIQTAVLNASKAHDRMGVTIARAEQKTAAALEKRYQTSLKVAAAARKAAAADSAAKANASATAHRAAARALEKRYQANLKLAAAARKAAEVEAAASRRSVEASRKAALAAARRAQTTGRASAKAAAAEARRTTTLERTTAALRRTTAATTGLATATRTATGSSRSFLITWQSIGRLIVVQLLHRAISALSMQIRQATQDAIEFQIRISELRTISQESQLSFSEWADGVREISDAFGLPILDVAESAYQTLSNQIAEGAETFEFLNEAIKLGVTTQADATQSVLLLTAALNSYELSSDQAEKVSGKLFKAIELGRLRSTELATSFGDVAVLARQTGINMDELLGLLSTLSIQGISAHKSMTQLRGIFVKLLKPTKDTKELFNQLGFESGEAALETLGLSKFLKLLADAAGNTSSGFAKFIPRIRGLSGILAAASKDFELLDDNIKQIRESGDSFSKAFEIAMESAGRSVRIEINKIKNFFTRDLGFAIVETMAKIAVAGGGFEQIVRDMAVVIQTILIPAVGAMIVSLLGLSAAWIFAHPVGAIVVAITAIVAAMRVWERRTRASILKVEKEWEKSWEKNRKEARKAIDETFDALAARESEIQRVADALTASIRAVTHGLMEETSEFTEAFGDSLEESIKNIVKDLKEGIKSIKKEVKDFENIVKDSESAVKNLRDALEKATFKMEFEDLDTQGQIDKLLERIDEMGERGKEAALKFDIKVAEEAGKQIIKDFETLKKLFRENAEDTEKNAEDRTKKARKFQDEVEKWNRRLRDARIKLADIDKDDILKRTRAERKIQDLIEDRNKALGRIKEEYEAIVDVELTGASQLKRINEEVLQQIAAIESARQYAEARAATARAAELAHLRLKADLEAAETKVEDFDIKEELQKKGVKGDEKAIRELSEQRRKDVLNLVSVLTRADTPEAEARIKEVIRLRQQEIVLANQAIANIELKLAEEVKQKAHEALKEEIKGLKETLVTLSDKKAKMRDLVALQKQLVTLGGLDKLGPVYKTVVDAEGKETKEAIDLLDSINNFYEDMSGQNLNQLAKDIDAVNLALVKHTSTRTGTTTEDYLRSLSGLITGDAKKLSLSASALINMAKIVEGLRNIGAESAGSIVAQINKILSALSRAEKEIGEDEEPAKKVLSLIEQSNESFKRGITIANDYADAMNRVAAAQAAYVKAGGKVTPAGPTLEPYKPEKQFGGPIGSDVVPSLLQPGEFVMNQASSKRFFSQLISMNSGFQGMAGGGEVNNSFGDFNINLKSSGSEPVDVVRIGKALRREIKLGRLTLA